MKSYSVEDLFNKEKNKAIDTEFHNFFNETLSKLPKKKRRQRPFIAVAAVVTFMMLSSTVMVFGKNIPGLKNIRNYFYAPEEYDKYVKPVDTVDNFDDLNVNIHDVIYDNNFLIYSYTVSRTDGKPIESLDDVKLRVSPEVPVKENQSTSGGDFIREKTDDSFTHYSYMIIKNLNLPDKMTLPFDIVYINDETKNAEIVKTINVEVDKTKLSNSLKEVKLNKDIKIQEGSIYLDSISFTPFGAIFFSENRGGWDFEGEDHYYFGLFDETGKQLYCQGTGVSYDSGRKVSVITKPYISSQYKGHRSITIKVYDNRTNSEVEGASTTIEIPNLGQ
ncbi:DUF4179 domain-containing protein [Clostridium sp. YIM B02505]|uniref:DUF4179 domain-containing protein n=1 Tax=Clostridium yunnanense TaxID=2800325 RepID=A0ABS1ELK2_9CLOT|nr:DUF4179 domain-containing protein [Clostridium yunnanense]MBK1810220.1 DUF4179 domain-containing protein [Clostridium yunnanense]